MSETSHRAPAPAKRRIERLQPWIAGVVTLLLHLLVLLLVLSRPPVTITTPQGAAAGSRTEVTFIDDTTEAPPVSTTAAPTPRPPQPDAPDTPAASRLQTTRVDRAEDPVPPDDTPVAPRTASRAPPPAAPDTVVQAPAATPTPPIPRPAHMRGQPPGMQLENVAPANVGMARSPAVDRGRGNSNSSAQSSLEIGGYQVYYEVRSEDRMREWRDQGIAEVYLPLPGIREYMICPLEVALRRGSGKCRLLDPYSPEMEGIGDAREVINMAEVYRRGEPVWRGPGPYR